MGMKFVGYVMPKGSSYIYLDQHLIKKKKYTIIQILTFFNLKFLHNVAQDYGFWLLRFVGLEFGFWIVEHWSSLVVATINAMNMLIIITSMSAHLGSILSGVYYKFVLFH
jgi:hypothetical protein